jgi:hypothetical protein
MNDDHLEEHAVLLLPGWRHKTTKKLHIRRDCRAVQYYAENMTPVLVRFDCEQELARVLGDGFDCCKYCFPGYGGRVSGDESLNT